MYRLYAQRQEGGWDKITSDNKLEEIEKEINKLDIKEYYSYMIIKNEGKGDAFFKDGKLSKECKVEYVDNLKTYIEVKGTEFKVSRMKKKEDLRKLTEEYIDR